MTRASRNLLAFTCTLALIPASIALAGGGQPGQTVRIASQVKLRNSAPAFHGKVKADNAACVEDRLVKMFKLESGGGKQLLGKDHAANSGKWAVPFDELSSGAYMAVAPKVTQGTAGTIYVCKRAKSKVIAVD